ncbi:thioredoxin-like protein [Basidiobolus meristosporus CBS 931.73]|uniref:protein disulfide-isomerase n=1 Tax=Basidiobolus meristosporus CBS 931.73 TaxID=1314790 RepID=A0A1Y1Y719_9FUNG|nr:thioredoxin-like protein [Basidiobolus meristosporus CBS 931.73]ORX93769.1 thioredoxin-like protein [Basidiobolus meristosporus CBS 931.73]|eukprot:ORX82201.1 thioredoxin-like protein [Basidiobolus meristosporus CBS 931.73]
MLVKSLLASLALYSSAFLQASALYSSRDDVVAITEKNFRKEVLETEQVVLMEFFAPWCGYCQKLVPDYKKVAQNLKGLVKVAAVDCDDEQNKPICATYGIQGFPTIKLFPSELKLDAKHPNKATKLPIDYTGPRSAKAMVDFAVSKIPSYVQTVSSDASKKKALTMEEFLAQGGEDSPKAILFTNKDKTTTLYKALSVDYHNRITLGQVKNTESEIVQRYNVEKFPTLLVFPKGAQSEPVVYDGALKHAALFEFMGQYAPSKASQKSRPNPPETKPFNPEIVKIESQAQLEQECLSKGGFCAISFLSVEPEYPESVAEFESNLALLRKVKKAQHDKNQAIHFVWVNALEKPQLMKDLDLSSDIPNMVVVKHSKRAYRPFIGGFDEGSLDAYLSETAQGKGRFFSYNLEPQLETRKLDIKDEL